MSKLFSDLRWTGEFFPPHAREKRFCGELEYSARNGVVLQYCIVGAEGIESEILHGVLSTGDKCTLLGRFTPGPGFNQKNDLFTQQGEVGFPFLAIGDFMAEDEQVSKVNFSLTNLEEFFFPKEHKARVKHSDKPIYSVSTPFGRMTVGNTAKFSYLDTGYLESQIYTREPTALKELTDAFADVQARYNERFMLKKDLAYRIWLEFEPSVSVFDAYKHVSSISNLFALLIYCPVFTDCIYLQKPDPNGHTRYIELYPSMGINPRTIELSTRNLSHYRMPITEPTVPFDFILSEWLKEPDDHSAIVSSIQFETGFRDQHAAHGDILLYATQMEWISHRVGKTRQKYEYPLERYCDDVIWRGLAQIFRVSTLSETAKAIGDLRNDIAHVGRKKIRLATLSLGDLTHISQYLRLAVIGYTLNAIGVPEDRVVIYQKMFSPQTNSDHPAPVNPDDPEVP